MTLAIAVGERDGVELYAGVDGASLVDRSGAAAFLRPRLGRRWPSRHLPDRL